MVMVLYPYDVIRLAALSTNLRHFNFDQFTSSGVGEAGPAVAATAWLVLMTVSLSSLAVFGGFGGLAQDGWWVGFPSFSPSSEVRWLAGSRYRWRTLVGGGDLSSSAN
ncbi:UDP-N-acetylglucosamine 2-epimerase [Striga asiatica]|uniref:UDP-N-acetylglucosamine 2-epimerase n=1 Tax=Striga asiatica TaxID=4170 RepID=A0A5A7RKV9_STRAF|nr:UDP-N-acetylglucosamine 2-epimerase [Striga asiatica]